MKKLVLERKHDRWVTIGSQHTNYSLENAMREVYHESGNRRFDIHKDRVYQSDLHLANRKSITNTALEKRIHRLEHISIKVDTEFHKQVKALKEKHLLTNDRIDEAFFIIRELEKKID